MLNDNSDLENNLSSGAANAALRYESRDLVSLNEDKIRILILTDGDGSFTESLGHDFSLSILADVLSEGLGFGFNIEVTKAYRGSPAGIGVTPGFVFQEGALDGFDEVWLFGMIAFSNAPLEAAEVEVLHRFMNSGGGVFATGDHDALGRPLCGDIPRVRSMRDWGDRTTAKFDSQVRFDTLRAGVDAAHQFTDESDFFAQELFPILRSGTATPPNCPTAYPHPLLCGPGRIIKFLPDHRHEGRCISDPDLSRKAPLGGQEVDEYPTIDGSSDGERLRPRLVAKGRAEVPHSTIEKDGSCHPFIQVDSFEAIVAYDGHEIKKNSAGAPASIGRVVVDSSFHHFVNVNLKGFRDSKETTPGRGLSAYEDIKCYFKNIASWLAPKPIQAELINRKLWAARWTYPLVEELYLMEGRAGTEAPAWAVTLTIGKLMRETLRILGSECEVLNWSADLIDRLSPGHEMRFMADPWLSRSNSSPTYIPLLDTEIINNVIVGGVALKIAAQYPNPLSIQTTDTGSFFINRETLESTLLNGARVGINALPEYITAISRDLGKGLTILEKFKK